MQWSLLEKKVTNVNMNINIVLYNEGFFGKQSNEIEVVGKQIFEFKILFKLYIIGSHYSTFLYVVC